MPSIVTLWFSSIDDLNTTQEHTLISELSTSESARYSSTRNPKKRREYLASRYLIRRALKHHYPNFNSFSITERESSPPLIAELPRGSHISLSHSNGFICFAIANCPVGIDVELSTKLRDFTALSHEIMTRKEIKKLERQTSDARDYFYRVWCAKEAYYKALEKHQQTTSFTEICTLERFSKNSAWNLHEEKKDNYQLSVVTKGQKPIINELFL